jgi:hypothetical protein
MYYSNVYIVISLIILTISLDLVINFSHKFELKDFIYLIKSFGGD